MSVLSRPVRHHVTAPTQREERIPLPRTSPEPDGPSLRTSPQINQPVPQSSRRTRAIMIVGGGLAVALAVGVGTYALVDGDGGSSTVIAPSVVKVPSVADLGRDAAAAARGAASAGLAASTAVTEAERQAALAQRLHNSGGDAAVFSSGSTTSSDAARLTEAQRDAALARRAQNFPS